MKNRLFVAFLFAALATPVVATAQGPTEPTAEHKMLAASAGTWNAVVEMMGEDGKPSKSTGTSVVRVACGGLWVLDDFDATIMGGPFQGHGTTGYDIDKKKFVGTWVDSMSTSVMTMEGTCDKDGKVMTMKGMAPGMDGKPVEQTMVTTVKDANTRVFEMFVTGPDGKAMKVMTITYTRANAKSDKK
jgi:hypothetical protein